MKEKNSPVQRKNLLDRARAVMPGGVSSPARALKAVGGEPFFVNSAKGARLFTSDGLDLVDWCMSFGPLILGHAHPRVVEAVKRAAERGTSYAVTTELEVELAEKVYARFPSVEMVRFVNSGTEAVMSAVRLARAYTGRNGIVKFAGCYHGHSDCLLVNSGSAMATLGIPSTPGVPEDFVKHTYVLPYNDIESVKSFMAERGDEIACILVEPVAGNMGVVPPVPGFLEGLREAASSSGALLIFDEVITGFRLARGGAQELFGIEPDLTVLGKILGAGLPMGAYGGRRDIMEMVAPAGSVYQAGTLAGNPLACAAGIACLDVLDEEDPYSRLEDVVGRFTGELAATAERAGVEVVINRIGSMFTLFFCKGEVIDFDSACRTDTSKFASFFNSMFKEGVYIPPANFEAWFLSTAHGEVELERTLEAVRKALTSL